MPTYSVSKTFEADFKISEKAAAVMRMFGVSKQRLRKMAVTHSCTVRIEAGQVVYITGPSGSGKSVLLRELQKCIGPAERTNLDEIELSSDKPLIDCFEADLVTSLRLLSTAGLNDVFCILNRPSFLSEGQKWRFRLAMALARDKKFIFADEFCCGLDRITAAVISHKIRRFADRYGVTFILASSHDDVLADLQPDILIVKELSGPTEVIYRDIRRGFG